MSNDISAMGLGILGIRKGMNGLQKNAQEIAGANIKNDVPGVTSEQAPGANDVTRALVEMRQNKLQVETSAKVVQTNSDLIGTLLDIKA